MLRGIALALAGSSTIAMTSAALAQPAQQSTPDAATQVQEANQANEAADDETVFITARRRAENLQDVPQSVTAITSDTLADLNITQLADISQLVPGLSLENGVSLRGITNNIFSVSNPIIQFYLNEIAYLDTSSAMFDIGQIEVLRGPQGTVRGKSAPSGAITLTTRRPDLLQVGGYANGSISDRGTYMLQGAVGVPIIADKLAVRLAGMIENEDFDVRSINSTVDPYGRREAFRGTVRFEPTDNLSAVLMYQYNHYQSRTFAQITGAGGGGNPDNPAIEPEDRLSVADGPNRNRSGSHTLIAQVDWEFAGQKLSYVGGAKRHALSDGLQSLDEQAQDVVNVLPNFEFYTSNAGVRPKETTHELRLSSVEKIGGLFDYTVGLYWNKVFNRVEYVFPAAALAGAFGSPKAAAVPGPINERYLINSLLTTENREKEIAVYGSITAYLGEHTEAVLGGRYLKYTRDFPVLITTTPAFNAVGFSCAVIDPFVDFPLVDSPDYPGSCDIAVDAREVSAIRADQTEKPFLYNASLLHHFSDDFMVYATIGTAFRVGGFSIGSQGSLECCGGGNPDLEDIADFFFLPSERSRSIEAGFKSNFFDNRARLNVAVYHQKFKNYAVFGRSSAYLNVTDPDAPLVAPNAQVSFFSFSSAAPAKVTGFEIEAGFHITPRFDVSGGFSWADSKLGEAPAPCSDYDFDGVPNRDDPDFDASDPVPTVDDFVSRGIMVARCTTTGDAISQAPKWTLSLQSEYNFPIANAVEGYVRGNMVYYPDNPNQSEFVVIDDYMLLNMFAGVRSPDGVWEAGVFVKNLTNTSQILDLGGSMLQGGAGTSSRFGPSNYFSVRYTPRRQFGFTARYAFGGR